MPFEINLTTEAANRRVAALNAQIDVLDKKLAVVNSRSIGLSRVGDSARELRASAGAVAVGLQNLGRSVQQVKDQVHGLSTSVTSYHKDATARFNKGVKGSNKELMQFRNTMNTTSKRAAVLRAGMYATGTHFGAFTGQTILAATAAYAFIKSIAAIITVGAQFEERMARANAVMGNFDKQGNLIAERSNKIKAEVQRLGSTTVFTMNEVAEGLIFLGMAGLDTEEATKALEPTLGLAAVGMLDMSRAADIATNIMLGFGRGAAELQEIVDVMSTAVISSNMNVEQLGNSLSYVAPIAQATNNSLKDTVAILEVFHDVGIKSSRAGTSLRRALVNLSKPTDKAQAVLNKLNVSLYDQGNNMKPLINIMRQLRDSQASVSDLFELFGARAGPAMVKLYQELQKEVDGGTSSFQKHRDEVDDVSGATKELMKNIENVLSADWKKLISALSKLATDIFEKVGPGIRDLVQGLTILVTHMDPTSVLKYTVAIVGMSAGLKLAAKGALMFSLALSPIPKVASLASKAIKILAVSLRFLAGPVGLVLTVAAGLVTYALMQTKSAKATEAATINLRSHKEILDTLAESQREYNELSNEGLQTKVRSLEVDLAKEMITLNQKQMIMQKAHVDLKGAQLRHAREEDYISKGIVKTGSLGLSTAKSFLTHKENMARLSRDEVVSQEQLVTTLEGQLDLAKGITNERQNVENIGIREKSRIIKKAKGEGPLDLKNIITDQKGITSALESQLGIRMALKDISEVEATGQLNKRRKEELDIVNAAYDVLIAKHTELKKKAEESVLILDPGKEGLKTFEEREKAIDKETKALDAVVRKKKEYTAATKKQIATGTALIAKTGAGLVAHYRTEKEAEYARHLDAERRIKEFYKTKEALQKDHLGIMKREQELHSKNLSEISSKQVVTVISGIASIFTAMAAASQTRYQMAQDEAQRTWDLYQEAQSRQEQFSEAAQNAQTAGDRNYYQSLANQYQAYSDQYRAQAEAAEVVAKRRFEQNKKMQEASALINTASAVAVTLGQLGYWGIPLAAAVYDQGMQMVRMIRAQEYQSPSDASGFGAAFGGLPDSPDSSGSNIADTPLSDGQTNALNIYIEGAITEEMINEVVIPVIKDGISEQDVIIIQGGDSAQLSEIQS